MLDTPSNAPAGTLRVERLSLQDVVAIAQCIAIDVTAFPHPSSRFALRPWRSPVWIARRRDEPGVLGFLAASERGRDLYIEGLATLAPARRSGVARALVRAALSFTHDAGGDTVSLHVWTGNQAAVDLYRSEAFGIVARVRGFYRPGAFASADAFRMVRPIA
jgi:ribosomal protein S18 acetylase RimI-like enzyme